ncbi:26S proteasome regulatory subunit 4 homolog A-like [Silene latifolia]|uniref:26S proteasome regulatory subunit 4 homolog A-like n=1 Tax=Silene latifolia TaxID=37657 RepID=UPI003D775F62
MSNKDIHVRLEYQNARLDLLEKKSNNLPSLLFYKSSISPLLITPLKHHHHNHQTTTTMGQGQSGLNRPPNDANNNNPAKKDKKFEPPQPPSRVGRKRKTRGGADTATNRLPVVTPHTKCKLRLLKLERIKDYLLMEEEFVSNQERLKPQEDKAEEDRSKVDDLRGSPMSVGNLEELIDENHAIVSSSVGPEYYVGILSVVDKDQLEPGCSILMHNKVLSVVGILQDEVDPMVSVMKVEKAPLESYADIGGLDAQIQEIKEAVELPLTHPELYEDIGIKPPKGVILYGEPGTGKTLLAKAVANSTSATFLRVVGSELIQKYLGDGPKLVRELFRVADELSPSIVFIDEIDAVGTKRYDAHSGGEREIQRTMLELLNQLDGFDSRGDVKVILATNKIESLDPALLRPGRIDRKIEFPLPDIKTRRHIFQIHTSKMTLSEDVNLEEFVMTKDEFSGADIKAICTEAGLLALRERRMKVTHPDFKKAKEKVMYKKKEGVPEGLYM